MTVTIERDLGNVTVYLATIARWDDDPAHPINDDSRQRIAGNIERALESQGADVMLY